LQELEQQIQREKEEQRLRELRAKKEEEERARAEALAREEAGNDYTFCCIFTAALELLDPNILVAIF
jgi:hypothetical protein